MAYVTPTAADIRTAYPEFGAVGDGPINNALQLASMKVDTSWRELPFNLAQKLYAAHVLVMQGLGTSATAGMFRLAPGGLKRRKAGDQELEFFGSPPVTGTQAWYLATSYGAQFYNMLREEKGGPRAA